MNTAEHNTQVLYICTHIYCAYTHIYFCLIPLSQLVKKKPRIKQEEVEKKTGLSVSVTRPCVRLCVRLGVCHRPLLPVSITNSAASEPTPLRLGVLRSLKRSWHADVYTPNSTNTVSREQPWRGACV